VDGITAGAVVDGVAAGIAIGAIGIRAPADGKGRSNPNWMLFA
jgi:hypothetical protein